MLKKIVECLFIAGNEFGLKCLNQCSDSLLNMLKKVIGDDTDFLGSKRHISAIMNGFPLDLMHGDQCNSL
jgi:hypothetical protein